MTAHCIASSVWPVEILWSGLRQVKRSQLAVFLISDRSGRAVGTAATRLGPELGPLGLRCAATPG